MQVRGVFPELNSGLKKSRPSSLGKLAKIATTKDKPEYPGDTDAPKRAAKRNRSVAADPSVGFGGFAVGTKPRALPANARTFAGRRNASHNKAYPRGK